ncbi:MAG: aldo/keto reductase [Acidobacteriota bacterium]
MEYRSLGRSGLQVSVLSLGTATFGGGNDFFKAWGSTQVEEAARLLDICMEAGVNIVDTADVYSSGLAEEILGKALVGRREQMLISTKATFRMEPGPNGLGSSRHHLTRACEASLRRLGTDYVDVYQMHSFDALTPVEETLRALEDLVRAGKVRYIGCSNFSGWHLMKSLAAADRYGLPRHVVHQAYYSLVGREYEWELMPLALEQGVGTFVWSPLAAGHLTGKIRRGQAAPADSRTSQLSDFLPIDMEQLYRVVDVLDELVKETGKTHAQISLNWLLARPTVCSVIFGARNEKQLRDTLGATGWTLDAAQIARLDEAGAKTPAYPYWHQRRTFSDRNPPAV